MNKGRFSIFAIFKAIDQLTGPVRKMSIAMRNFAHRNKRAVDALNRTWERLHTGAGRAMKLMGGAAVASATALGVALAKVVRTGTEFDQVLTAAAAKLPGQVRRGTKEFELLENAAKKVGDATQFSASEAAMGLEELAAAGFGATQAVAALPGVVDLATAGQMELGRATEIAANTLNAFGLMSSDSAKLTTNLARVNDVLATAANQSTVSVEDLFEAFKFAGPVANAAGASIETVAALSAELGNNAIKGSMAGTGLRAIFNRLQAPAGRGAKAIRGLGIQIADAHGNMRDVITIIGELGEKLDGMGTAERGKILKNIFGDEAVASANVLLAAGAEKLEGLRKGLEGAAGANAKMAKVMRDTAGGDLKELSSAIESVELEIWSVIRGPFREVVKATLGWIRANKGLLKSKAKEFVEMLRRELPPILEDIRELAGWVWKNREAIAAWGKRIAALVVTIWAVEKAIWAGKVAMDAFTATKLAIRALSSAIKWTTVQMKALDVATMSTSTKMGGMRAALNASALGAGINGVTSKLGKAGLLGAALSVGYAIGTWLNDTFKLSDSLDNLIGKVTGLNDELAKQNRTNVRGLQPGQGVLADGSPAFPRGGRGQLVTREERVSRAITESTRTDRAEVVIRDESGRAEVTKKPKGGLVGIRQPTPSGAF